MFGSVSGKYTQEDHWCHQRSASKTKPCQQNQFVGLNEANYRLCINYIRQHQQTDVRGNDIISAVTTVPGGTATALSVTHW